MDSFVFNLYRGFGALIALLPLRVGVVLGRVLGWLGYWVAWKYRRVVLRNIEIAFPGKAPHLRRRLARAHFAMLIGNLFAMEKIARMPAANVAGLVETDGLDIVLRLAEEGRGFVFLIGHIGNWELLAQMAPMLFPVPSGTIYQRLGSARMDEHVRAVRARAGLALFERKEGFNAAAEMLRKGGGVGVLVDQHAGDAGVWCPLFGRLASTSPLAATLAARADAAVLSIAMHTHGIGRWRMVIRGPHDTGTRDAREATARLNAVLEEMIRREPRDWFWVHNRWKTPRPKFLLATYKRGIVAPPPPTERQLDEAESGELFAFAAKKQTLGTDGKLQPFRILIRSSNWLGDAVMTVPAVRSIKHGRPDAHVTVLTPAKLADVWKLVPEVDAVIAFDAAGGSGWRRALASVVHVFKVARLVRGRGWPPRHGSRASRGAPAIRGTRGAEFS
jgi:heptosyltransferase II